jgi:uncharacterized protein
MPFTITLLIAAALAIVNLWLAARIVRLRFRDRVLTGHGDLPLLETRMRAQANFAEYVPIALILMALIEWRTGPNLLLWIIGAALVIGRLVHPLGMDARTVHALRGVGIALTWLTTLALAIWALYLVFATEAVPAGLSTIA